MGPGYRSNVCRERQCRADRMVSTPDRAPTKENQAMKYMLMMFGDAGPRSGERAARLGEIRT